MKLAIATDHAGREMKMKVIEFLIQNQFEVLDLSKVNTATDDYPDKVKGIRAAHVENVYEAKMTRLDNNANILAFSSRLDFEDIKEIIKTFINTEFSNEERHIRRVDKIIKFENGEYNEL